MTTYHKQYPGVGSLVRVIAKTDEGSREIAQCSGPVIGAVNSFTQATEDADLIVAALNASEQSAKPATADDDPLAATCPTCGLLETTLAQTGKCGLRNVAVPDRKPCYVRDDA